MFNICKFAFISTFCCYATAASATTILHEVVWTLKSRPTPTVSQRFNHWSQFRPMFALPEIPMHDWSTQAPSNADTLKARLSNYSERQAMTVTRHNLIDDYYVPGGDLVGRYAVLENHQYGKKHITGQIIGYHGPIEDADDRMHGYTIIPENQTDPVFVAAKKVHIKASEDHSELAFNELFPSDYFSHFDQTNPTWSFIENNATVASDDEAVAKQAFLFRIDQKQRPGHDVIIIGTPGYEPPNGIFFHSDAGRIRLSMYFLTAFTDVDNGITPEKLAAYHGAKRAVQIWLDYYRGHESESEPLLTKVIDSR